jgi:aspartyl-tRNA(Asn)/glutamyl-tRNA(Gln) amidotransferase subunit A
MEPGPLAGRIVLEVRFRRFFAGPLGSDTGGSILGPAAANGIAGLKPTYGPVSHRGVFPNWFSHDHAGPLAWTSEDVAILM